MDIKVLHNLQKNADITGDKPYTLVFSKSTWLDFKDIGFDFSKDDFKKAEGRKDSYLGERKGIQCYLLKPWGCV